MADTTVDEAHQRILGMSASHSLLAFPILLAVHRLGGSAKKKDVEAEVRRLVDGKISKDDLDQLKSRGRFGFSRYELKARGLIEGESGTWALTPLGKSYMAAHANDPIEIPTFTLEPLRDAEAPQVPTERVDTTSFHAFELGRPKRRPGRLRATPPIRIRSRGSKPRNHRAGSRRHHARQRRSDRAQRVQRLAHEAPRPRARPRSQLLPRRNA